MKKVAIVYGEMKNDIQKRALEELTRTLLDYTVEYPVCLQYTDTLDTDAFRCIYIGTKDNNPYIQSVSKNTLSAPESYAMSVKNSTVVIEGYDDAGVLYGVLDFYNKYIIKFEHSAPGKFWVNLWDNEELPDFEYTSAPSIKERGLWTWGHVIYDYREYLHNMMRLKMNCVIIWNDFVPTNARDIVEYAHSCNIRVIWGFAWLWDVHCDVFDLEKLEGEPEKIFSKYEREYASACGDGIYFQTFTELETDNINGVLIADAAAKFVNKTAGLFYEKYPNIEIQFGLHADSVKKKLEFISAVDPKIRIVWENCGSFPFAWLPTCIEDFSETKEFVRKITCLRGKDDCFGVVTKGLVMLDWKQFEHLQGSQCIGVSSKYMKANRVERKSRIWKRIQAGWLIHADKAHEMIKEMCDMKDGDMSSFALVEDGMFEENIMYPVALYSEMLWDCKADTKNLMMEVALRSYVCFE